MAASVARRGDMRRSSLKAGSCMLSFVGCAGEGDSLPTAPRMGSTDILPTAVSSFPSACRCTMLMRHKREGNMAEISGAHLQKGPIPCTAVLALSTSQEMSLLPQLLETHNGG